MGFVADDEVEGRGFVLFLGFDDGVYGVVGGEDDIEPFGAFFEWGVEFAGEDGGVGGGGEGEVVEEDVFLFAADAGVGADDEVAEGGGALRGPFVQGLGEEGEGGDQEEDVAAGGGRFFR